jgi:mannose-6-phosphate isomerase-like protein (cupin superfamily)
VSDAATGSGHGEGVGETRGFDLEKTYVHLGLGSVAYPIEDFAWTPEFLEHYEASTRPDGAEGRLVCVSSQAADWKMWERHPAGDELVVQLSGRAILVQEIDGVSHRIELGPGEAAINPRGAWHTADVIEAGRVLFVTPGLGTEHRPR